MVLFFLAGAAAALRGVWMLSPAVGWIALGLLLLFVAAWPVVARRLAR